MYSSARRQKPSIPGSYVHACNVRALIPGGNTHQSIATNQATLPARSVLFTGETGVGIDVWCPLGANSDPIPFFRSQAALSDDEGAYRAETRSPVNHATAFVDLDFVYGRSEDEAAALRTEDDTGFMNITERGLPFLNADGTWLVRKPTGCEKALQCFVIAALLFALVLCVHHELVPLD